MTTAREPLGLRALQLLAEDRMVSVLGGLADGPIRPADKLSTWSLTVEANSRSASTRLVVALRFGASSRFARSASTPSASSTASPTSSTTSSASISARRCSRGSTWASVGWSG